MQSFRSQSLSLDAIHGYIPFTSPEGIPEGEAAERDLIDHPWIQRLRQIHQLQTAWWVFPTAEHTRFQHVLGAMHLASRAAERLYPSLREVCPDAPSRGYVETLLRLAALLHDVGHGPFGHFFDRCYLADYGLTHETLGAEIIRRDLADLVVRVRRNPNTALEDHETLDPAQIGLLITRPAQHEKVEKELGVGSGELGAAARESGVGSPPSAFPLPPCPQWLRLLRSLFSGLYTVDNMDFVLRDAYMSGYSARAFDLDRLLHYSAFTSHGLTVHERGLSALVRFIAVRGELFRAIYFHRTVRAIDLSLQELFADSKAFVFPGNPLEHLEEYQQFTEWSLLARVAGWHRSSEPALAELGRRWRGFLARKIRWKMACERTIFFRPGEAEKASVFGDQRLFEATVRSLLPAELRRLPLRFDLSRHVFRPGSAAPAAGQNFLFDPASGRIRSLDARELFRQIPVSFRICRIYAESGEHNAALAAAIDQLLEGSGADDTTNM